MLGGGKLTRLDTIKQDQKSWIKFTRGGGVLDEGTVFFKKLINQILICICILSMIMSRDMKYENIFHIFLP
jgi:hypothetical protein